MAYLIKSGVQFLNLINEFTDPRVENYFLINVMVVPLIMFCLFFYCILDLLPNVMKDREPFKLDKLLIFYNFVQVIACTYVVCECWSIIMFKFDMRCQNINYSSSASAIRELKVCYLYFLIKVADLADTIFFVLRKKFNQISFLHLYHHGGMAALTYGITKYYGGGSVLFIPFLNSFVHIFMYSYYLLSVYQKGNKHLVVIKKYITQLQLVQFCVLIVLLVRVAFAKNCNIPAWVAWVFIVQTLFMIALFTDFYMKTYVYNKKRKSVEVDEERTDGSESFLEVKRKLEKEGQKLNERRGKNVAKADEKRI